MKKNIFIILLLSNIFVFGQSSNKTDWDERELKGEIKTLLETEYKVEEKFGETQHVPVNILLILFNSKGKYITIKNFIPGSNCNTDKWLESINGCIVSHYSYTYDNNGNLIAITSDYSKEKFTYIDEDKISKWTLSNQYSVIEEKTYQDGKLVIYDKLNKSDDFKRKYKYDNQGNIIEINRYSKNGNPYMKYTLKYDNQRNITEFNEYDENNNLIKQNLYKYDERGRNSYAEEILHGNYHIKTKWYYQYDEKGNCININKQELSSMDILRNHEKRKYEYKYDEKGNWIKKTEFINDNSARPSEEKYRKLPEYILERKIDYWGDNTSKIFKEKKEKPKFETFTDPRDNITYKTVKIGNQVWMAENLKATKYSLVDESIPEVITLNYDAWNRNTPVYYKTTYGHLYNNYAATTWRKICPTGWHLPTDDEWEELFKNISDNRKVVGGKMKETGTNIWKKPEYDKELILAGTTNESGFSALPSGFIPSTQGKIYGIGEETYFWSATWEPGIIWYWKLTYKDLKIEKTRGDVEDGASVRCIKDQKK